jgi:WD40 repeat protein
MVVADASGPDYGPEPRTRTLGVWDTATGRRHAFAMPAVGYQMTHEMAFSPDGTVLAVTDPDRVRLLDPVTGRQRGTVAVANAAAMAFRPGSSVLVTVDWDGEVQARDVKTGVLHRTLAAKGYFTTLAFSPDGTILAGAGPSGAGFLSPWNQTAIRSLEAACLGFEPHGSMLLTGDDNGHVRYRDPASGRVRSTRSVGLAGVGAIAVSPDGKTMATTASSGRILLWDLP